MSADHLDQLDYYTLLGVGQQASARDIRRAFRRFARRYHPDRYTSEAEERRVRATAIYRRGSEGLQVLCDPAARKLYDEALEKGVLRLRADERDGASRAERVAPKKEGPAIHSPQARAFYKKGVAAARKREYRTAWKHFHQALDLEPANKVILEAIKKVDVKIRRGS
jgi:curved DNA-binding protein CbpA